MKLSCPYEYPNLDENRKECIKSDINDNNIIYSTINLLNDEMNENTTKTINSIFQWTYYNIDSTINIINYDTIETNNLNEEEIDYYDNILQNIEIKFTSENYDIKNLDNGKDEIINNDRITTTLTTSENQKNNIYNNMTKIDLGECEYLLRNFYNISKNESLYIKK